MIPMNELKEAMDALERLRNRVLSDYLKMNIARVQVELIALQEAIVLLQDSGYKP